MFTSGISVIDTSSLWSTWRYLHDTTNRSRNTTWHNNKNRATLRAIFLSFIHNIILYDELRTDFGVLSEEPASELYREHILTVIKRIRSKIKITGMPATSDDREIINA